MEAEPHNTGTEQILRRTLNELIERGGRLATFERELADARAAIKVIEKALGKRKPASTSGRGHTPPADGLSPRARFTQRVVELVSGAAAPMTREQIALGLGREDDVFLGTILQHAVKNGHLDKRGGMYATPRALAA